MPRPKGSLNKKGKQSADERKANRKASTKANTIESRQKEFAKRKIDRRAKQIQILNERIRQQRHELYSVGQFSGVDDPALKELGKLLDGSFEDKLTFIQTHGNISLDSDTDMSHLN